MDVHDYIVSIDVKASAPLVLHWLSLQVYLGGKFQNSRCHTRRHFPVRAGVSNNVEWGKKKHTHAKKKKSHGETRSSAANYRSLSWQRRQLQRKYCQSALPVGSQQFSPHQLGLRRRCCCCCCYVSFYPTVGCSNISWILLSLPFFFLDWTLFESDNIKFEALSIKRRTDRARPVFLSFHSLMSEYSLPLNN